MTVLLSLLIFSGCSGKNEQVQDNSDDQSESLIQCVEFEGKEMEFEKYDVRVSGDSSEKITVTYYFKDEKPYSEVMQSERGKTVFLFKTVSDSIKDKDIFKISDEYSETD